jgi:aerobic-type carbon monoxide dehydrogenase small subunit (CoxS/CutS family)
MLFKAKINKAECTDSNKFFCGYCGTYTIIKSGKCINLNHKRNFQRIEKERGHNKNV